MAEKLVDVCFRPNGASSVWTVINRANLALCCYLQAGHVALIKAWCSRSDFNVEL